MKYTITINQYAVFKAGLVNKTDIIDWVIIDYLKDFVLYKKSKKVIYQNEEYIWLNYNHLIASLPLTQLRYKPKVSLRIHKLRDLGLIRTVKDRDNSLYYTFTDKLIDICFARVSDITKLKKSTDAPVTKTETPPVTRLVTPPVTKTVTAQYKTNISIINKDKNNKNDISFSSSFLKNKELKPKTTDTFYKPHKPIRKGRNGFKSMSGGIWNVIDNIRQRQMQNKNSNLEARNSKQIQNHNLEIQNHIGDLKFGN